MPTGQLARRIDRSKDSGTSFRVKAKISTANTPSVSFEHYFIAYRLIAIIKKKEGVQISFIDVC